MTSEQNVPEVEFHQGAPMSAGQQDGDEQFSGPNVPHGMGQSKSSRRRRRKRKNKGTDALQGVQPGGEQAGEQAIGAIQAATAQAQQQGAQNFQAGAGQAGCHRSADTRLPDRLY